MLQAHSYAPAPRLSPFVGRYYVFSADLHCDFTLHDKLMSETAFIRLLLKGDWRASTRSGSHDRAGPAVLFGANSKPLPVEVRGGFRVVGIALRPAGWMALMGVPADACGNDMVPLSDIWGQSALDLVDQLSRLRSDADIVVKLDQALQRRLARADLQQASLRAWTLERLLLRDNITTVRELSGLFDMSPRQLERFARQHFGFAPKTLLQRQRFLTIASAMRGLGRLTWDVLAADRYYDQSHLTREFRQFIGLTPGQFLSQPTPLLDAGLRLRSEILDVTAQDSPKRPTKELAPYPHYV